MEGSHFKDGAQNRAGQRIGEDRTREGRTGQNKRGQAGQDRTGQDRTGAERRREERRLPVGGSASPIQHVFLTRFLGVCRFPAMDR